MGSGPCDLAQKVPGSQSQVVCGGDGGWGDGDLEEMRSWR